VSRFLLAKEAMAGLSRRIFLSLAAALVVASMAIACSGAASDPAADGVGTSGENSLAVNVRNTAFDVTVENTAGMPLVDVVVSIKPVGRTPYTKFIPRLENGQQRSLVLSEFTGNDGTAFNLKIARVQKPRVQHLISYDVVDGDAVSDPTIKSKLGTTAIDRAGERGLVAAATVLAGVATGRT
jgi:hypothetical protein